MAIYEPGEARPKTERSPDDNKEYVAMVMGITSKKPTSTLSASLNDDGSYETALIAMKSTQLKKSTKVEQHDGVSLNARVRTGRLHRPALATSTTLKRYLRKTPRVRGMVGKCPVKVSLRTGALYYPRKGFCGEHHSRRCCCETYG